MAFHATRAPERGKRFNSNPWPEREPKAPNSEVGPTPLSHLSWLAVEKVDESSDVDPSTPSSHPTAHIQYSTSVGPPTVSDIVRVN